MSAGPARVFNIPASAPFLPALIEALVKTEVEGFPFLPDPLKLAEATLYLPTRRACRLARDVFLDVLGTEAAILPRIVAIGDIDEDEIAFAEAATGDLADTALSLSPSVAPLERRLILAGAISVWANLDEVRAAAGAPLVANTTTATFNLASDLGRLIDDMETREVDWAELESAIEIPLDIDEYWQKTLRFLNVARDHWESQFKARGVIEPAKRRDKLIETETKRLASSNAPVIAAGSTGSMPATAKLLATIARMRHGAVVLPGLDTTLDSESWRLIAGASGAEPHDGGNPAASHAQFAMHGLLDRIGIPREAVKPLAASQSHSRERLVSEALRPAATTQAWQKQREDAAFAADTNKACASLTMIEAATTEEEALAIAVALREAVETKGKTAALVTPDRALARRVAAALERWEVPVDDSGGDSLADTSAGVFARLAAETALAGVEPVTLLALLKHPLLRLDSAANAHTRAVSALERAILRGPRPSAGTAGLKQALETFRATRGKLHPNDPRKSVSSADLDAAEELIDKLATALKPLETAKKEDTLASLAGRHREVIVALGKDAAGKIGALAGHGGATLDLAFTDLINTPAASSLSIDASDYAELFHAAIGERIVRRPEKDVRVRIFGPLEARLQTVQRLIVGGLNEGSWPPETRSDPWLSRPMRHTLGLNLPELRIGLSAHDFAQALGASEVILTRAAKSGGSPAVTSRFVQRLAAVAGKERWDKVRERGDRYVALAQALDYPAKVKPEPRPQPDPPLDVRPMQLSVTDIENWLRDPYTIYAKHVLRLFPFEPIDAEPGAADRGSVIHEAIGDFTKRYASALPSDPESELLAHGKKSFAPMQDFPEAQAFWWPRFKRIAHWFVGWERKRRPSLAAVHGEVSGKLAINIGARSFTLTARADRIEAWKDGTYAILDYKTGQPPTEPQVRTGLAPQLTLEAAILRKGGFENVAAGSVAFVSYVRLRGGEKAGEDKEVKFKEGTPDTHADRALARLTGVAARFLNDGEPYRSLVHPMWQKHYGDYDHLARVKEWAASGGESEYVEPPS